MGTNQSRRQGARDTGAAGAQWIRRNLLASGLVLAGLVALLVMAFSGASQQAIAWSGLVIGVFVGVVIAAASRGEDG